MKHELWAEESKLYCSAEWHLARFKTQCAGIVHSHALKMSKQSENYYCSIRQMADYFDKNRRTIAAAFRELTRLGFFEVIRHDNGKAVNYRPVGHKEWAEKHPAQCIEKLAMPWDGEGDPLGRMLYSVCGGAIKVFFPNVLTGLRKSGFTDDQIVSEWKDFLAWEQEMETQYKYGWKGVIKRFKEYLEMKKCFYAQRPSTSDAPVVVHGMQQGGGASDAPGVVHPMGS